MNNQIRDNKPLRIVTGSLQITYSAFLFIFASMLVLLFAIIFGVSESLGGEVSAENLALITIAQYVWFLLSIVSLVNGILLITRKPSKVAISILNIIYMAIISILFIAMGGIVALLSVFPIALLILNVFVLINAKKVKNNRIATFNQEQASAEEIVVE